MDELIYPRSPRETMGGWMHLPRYIDKIRLSLNNKLHPDYQAHFGKGFDGIWLEAAGLKHEDFIEMVRNTITDGQVADWIRTNVRKSDADREKHRERVMNYPAPDNPEAIKRFKQRKVDLGIAHREDVQCFVDLIDADEKRI